MVGPRPAPRALRLLSLCACGAWHRARADSSATLQPLPYGGPLRTSGLVNIAVESFDGDMGNILEYALLGADPRCSGLPEQEALAANGSACSLRIRLGHSCQELGGDLWRQSPDEAKDVNPWENIGYTASPNGTAQGFEKCMSQLSHEDMYKQFVVATNFDGKAVACGQIVATCLRILGTCFTSWARLCTGTATVLAVISSLWLIRLHLLHNKNPVLCRYTIRILLIVPVYAVQSFISLWLQVDATTAEIFRFFREFYEAIVILSFLEFILVCVGGAEYVVQVYDGGAPVRRGFARRPSQREPPAAAEPEPPEASNEPPDVAALPSAGAGAFSDSEGDSPGTQLGHICPWSLLCPRWASAQQMLRFCTLGTLSYVLTGMTVPFAVLICRRFLGPEAMEEVLSVAKKCFMISSMLAINSLFELAHIFLDELKDLAPLAKFLSVKMVIFFTFWQGLVLSWAESGGAFNSFVDPGRHWNSTRQIAEAVQHGAICFEMLAASIVHHWAFPPRDYQIVREMNRSRSRTRSHLSLEGEAIEVAMQKGAMVVDFRDVLRIARRGFAPTRFAQTTIAPDSEDDDASSEEEEAESASSSEAESR